MAVSTPRSTAFGFPTRTRHTPAANTAAVATLAAVTGQRHMITQIDWSYGATPTSGTLTINLGAETHTYYVVVAGPGQLFFPEGLFGDESAQVVVTLSAGGASVSGAVQVHSH